jgi:membrane protein implicated in regulation of membrane protease activity
MLDQERRGTVGQQLVGKVGSVTHRVRGGERPGEVRVVVGGLPHHYLAFCPIAVPVGAQVLVVNVRGPRQLDVEPWGQ